MITEFPHFHNVEGWLDTQALLFTSYFSSKFIEPQEFDSLEIGVHHGKFFIGIENLTPVSNRSVAIDCFSQQSKNVDGSGRGDLSIFLNNCQRFAKNYERVIPLELDSLQVNCAEVGEKKFGIISVDGCHTERHTVNDLQVAQKLMAPTSIVVLDDILNQDWMGVVSGACRFFSTSTELTPFAVGFNKLFCCPKNINAQVQNTVMHDHLTLKSLGIVSRKKTEFFGYQIISLVSA